MGGLRVACLFLWMPLAAMWWPCDSGFKTTSTPHPAKRLFSLRPLERDAPLKFVGPLVGHGWFKLGFWVSGVGACPHEGGYHADRRAACRPARSGIFVFTLAAASLLACIARHS